MRISNDDPPPARPPVRPLAPARAVAAGLRIEASGYPGERAIRFATGMLIALSVGLLMAIVALALCPGPTDVDTYIVIGGLL
jgi:hypothetical protein